MRHFSSNTPHARVGKPSNPSAHFSCHPRPLFYRLISPNQPPLSTCPTVPCSPDADTRMGALLCSHAAPNICSTLRPNTWLVAALPAPDTARALFQILHNHRPQTHPSNRGLGDGGVRQPGDGPLGLWERRGAGPGQGG